jgi:hypothetical protein
VIDYHAAFVVCAACGRADPLPLSIPQHGGFQMALPEGWDIRRYQLGASAVWAICPACLEREPLEAPTCIACANPMSGHVADCRSLAVRYEDGMAPIMAMEELLTDRKNDLWEIWDFIERKLVGEFPREEDAKAEIIRLLSEDSSRVRFLVRPPHNVIYLDGYRR